MNKKETLEEVSGMIKTGIMETNLSLDQKIDLKFKINESINSLFNLYQKEIDFLNLEIEKLNREIEKSSIGLGDINTETKEE